MPFLEFKFDGLNCTNVQYCYNFPFGFILTSIYFAPNFLLSLKEGNILKKLALFLVIVMAVTPIFAVSGYIGGTFAPQFGWYSYKVSSDSGKVLYDQDLSETLIVIGADGATYWGKQHQFGIGYGFDIGFTVGAKAGDTKLDTSDFGVTISPNVSFQYRYLLNKNLAIETGTGFQVDFVKDDFGEKSSISMTTFSLVANVDALYNITDQVGLKGGVSFAIPLGTTGELETGASTISANIDRNGFILKPYFSVGYCY